MPASYKVNIRRSDIERVAGTHITWAVNQAARVTAKRAKQNITQLGRIDTGAMRDSIKAEPQRGRTMNPSARVISPAPYSAFQEYGTRAHGPVRAKFLRFKPKGSSTFVFAKWVRGVTPGRFMQKALRALTTKDFTWKGPL